MGRTVDSLSPGAVLRSPEKMFANHQIAKVGAGALRALKETIIRHDARPAQFPPAASGNEQGPPEQPKLQEAEPPGSRRQGA
jgi:hypothetical protein